MNGNRLAKAAAELTSESKSCHATQSIPSTSRTNAIITHREVFGSITHRLLLGFKQLGQCFQKRLRRYNFDAKQAA